MIARYEYDALNRRTKKHLNADTDDDFDSFQHFFYNAAWQILETRDADDVGDEPEDIQPEYQNIWSLRYIDAPVLRDKNTDTDDLCDDERLYFTNDANMNVTSLVGTDGTVLERYLYDPYGKLTVLDADFSADANGKSDYDNSILFCGYYHDWETGLALARRRYYHPLLGRWITRDPVRYQRKRQLYVYTQGKPLVETDPFGLKSASVLWTGILIQEHNTRESLQAVCGEKAGGCTKPSVSVTLNVEISFSTDLCYVGITEVKWGSTVHLPAEEVFGSIDPAMKEYESHREFLHSFPNKAWYNSKGVPRTYESILAHELTHGVQQYKAGQLATHYVINYYNFLEMFSYDTYAKAERERAKQEAGDDPERLILKDLDYHASILFPPGENFEPTEACEEEAVEEERKSLETQYQEWKAKQSQP